VPSFSRRLQFSLRFSEPSGTARSLRVNPKPIYGSLLPLGPFPWTLFTFSDPAPDTPLAVQEIISTRKRPSGEQQKSIGLYGEGVTALLKLDAVQFPKVAGEGKISRRLKDLLALSLRVAEAGLRGQPGLPGCVSKPWDGGGMTEFERFIRTGTWAPQHPVIRTLPPFRYDYNCEMARARKDKNIDAAQSKVRVEALKVLDEQAKSLGTSCTKFRTSHRALTPGLFTVFCAGCGVCECLEMMDHSECPLVPFRELAHRAWRPADFVAREVLRQTGVWKDSL
jgi:hypothetical protein